MLLMATSEVKDSTGPTHDGLTRFCPTMGAGANILESSGEQGFSTIATAYAHQDFNSHPDVGAEDSRGLNLDKNSIGDAASNIKGFV